MTYGLGRLQSLMAALAHLLDVGERQHAAVGASPFLPL
jgi:hypothetical protein